MKTTCRFSLFTLLPSLFLFLLSGCFGCRLPLKPAATLQPAPAPVTQVMATTTTVTHSDSALAFAPNRAAYDYTQRLYAPAPGATTLLPQQHAAETVNAFKPVYTKLNNPRIIIYVNSDLPGKAQPATTATITDRQTTRDIERITARPFRYAGATLVDQQTAAALNNADFKQIADIAIEVLVSSRNVSIPNATNGVDTYAIPDIQMTAIRLSDSAIIGQATSADITNQLPARALGTLNVQDVLEATSLNLMADITATAK